jgi:hypothetical protein
MAIASKGTIARSADWHLADWHLDDALTDRTSGAHQAVMRPALLLVLLGSLAACGGSTAPVRPGNDSGSPESGADGAPPDAGGFAGPDSSASAVEGGDAMEQIGTPCVPAAESNPTFDGFESTEISLSTGQPSGSPLCVAYHFRGLVTCPYGQSATGQAPAGASPCTTSSGQPVVGAVAAQCVDRPASKVVIWSCRCANASGTTTDGDVYCACPSGTTCAQAVASIGGAEDDLSGAYCLPPDVVIDGGVVCGLSCDPATTPCPL